MQTITPAREAGSLPRPVTTGLRVPLALYALTGFSGLLAEQGFEKYLQLLVGATASASAVVLFTYFLGFAAGGIVVARLLRAGRVGRPLLLYGLVELAVGIACILFSYCFHPVMSTLAPLQNFFAGAALKFQVRFVCGCLLVLPAAALMGASFPLIAHALDNAPAQSQALVPRLRREPRRRRNRRPRHAILHHACHGTARRALALFRHWRRGLRHLQPLFRIPARFSRPPFRRSPIPSPARFASCWPRPSVPVLSSSRSK